MTVVVTGATGFVGTKLVEALIARGVCVIALTRSTGSSLPTSIEQLSCDLPVMTLATNFRERQVSGVIHLASLFLKDHKEEQIEALVDANLAFGIRVLEAAVKGGCGWFLNTGTFWQHHHSRKYRPANLYAATKQAFEVLAEFYWRTNEIRFVTLKLNDTFGPGDTRPKIFSLWRKALVSASVLAMSGGRQKVNFLYIDDVVSAYLALVDWVVNVPYQRARGRVFGASGRPTMELKQVARLFESVSGGHLKISWGALPYRAGEVMRPWSFARRVPGWKPRVSLRDGIQKVLEADGWYQMARASGSPS